MQTNKLYCADNLEVMKLLPTEYIDLIYIDPPFNTGKQQKTNGIGYNDKANGGLSGYILFMRERLFQMHRLLKPTGSLFVHLDWRMAHYIKIELDKIFEVKNPCSPKSNFLNEVIWCYTGNQKPENYFTRKHDTILVYSKGNQYTFNPFFVPYKESTLRRYNHKDKKGRFKINSYGGKKTKAYMSDQGMPVYDYWTDIPALVGGSKEKGPWPTQKPLKLLNRFIRVFSNPGDLVADFFCGCGTSVVSAHRLGRKWIGCDISSKAIEIAQKRLDNHT